MTHLLEVQGYNRRFGSERHTAILSRRLAEKGWRVTVAAPPGGLLDAPGVLGRASFLPVALHGRRDVGSVLRLTRFCLREGVDVVHTHCRNADLLGGAAALAARTLRLGHGPRLVTTVHGMLVGSDGRAGADAINRAHRWFLGRGPDLVIGVSEAVSANLRRVLRDPRAAVVTIPNGTEPPTVAQIGEGRRLAAALRTSDGEVLLVQAGALEPSKGADTLLLALERLVREGHRVRLVLVGGGGWEAHLRRTAGTLGLADRTTFTGVVADAVPYLAAADVVCLASRWEGFGRVLTEAMSCSRPVVASRTGGIPEIVEDGVTGILAEPDNVDAWTSALSGLVADPDRRAATGARGRERYTRLFTAEGFVEATAEALAGVLAPASRHERQPDLLPRHEVSRS